VARLVEALRYKLEGRGFDSRWLHWDLLLAALCPCDQLTEMITRFISWGLKRPVCRAENFTTFMRRLSKNSWILNLQET